MAKGAGLRPTAKAVDEPPDPNVHAPQFYPNRHKREGDMAMRSRYRSGAVWALLLLLLIAPTCIGCSRSQEKTGPEVQFFYGRSNVSVYYPDQGKFFLYNADSSELEAIYTIPANPGGRIVKEKPR